MSTYLVVEIEHNRYARFLPLDSKNRGELNLTTLVNNQKKAEVKIYIVYKGKKQLFHTFSVSPIPRQKAGEPRLLLSGTFDGNHGVRLSLKVNGKLWTSSDISIKKYVRSKKTLLFVSLALLLLVLGLGLVLLVRGCGPGGDKEQSSRVGTEQTTGSYSSKDAAEQESSEAGETSEDKETPDSEESASAGEPDTVASGESETLESEAYESEPQETEPSEVEPQEAVTEESEAREAEAPENDAREEPDREASAEFGPTEDEPSALPEDTTVFFKPDRSSITSTAAEKLSRLTEQLAEFPDAELKITGHCALYGTEQGRIELSRERAKAVEDFLYRQGWSPETPPEVTGVAGKEPLTKDRDRQQLNRRVIITVD